MAENTKPRYPKFTKVIWTAEDPEGGPQYSFARVTTHAKPLEGWAMYNGEYIARYELKNKDGKWVPQLYFPLKDWKEYEKTKHPDKPIRLFNVRCEVKNAWDKNPTYTVRNPYNHQDYTWQAK